MKELASALAKAQGMMKAAIKDSTNPHFKSKYADLTSVWEACRDALTKNGLSVVQSTDFDGDTVWIETILLHSSGEHIKGRYPLRPQQQTPQGYGSAISYARRYALAAMVGVVSDDDDGNEASKPAPRRDAPAPAPDEYEANLAKAQKWVANAMEFIGNCISDSEIDAWYGQNAAALAKLKSNHGELFRQVEAAMKSQREFVRVKDAAE